MALRKQLVTAHLEGISWRIFKQYPEAVRDLIRGDSVSMHSIKETDCTMWDWREIS